MASGEVDLLVVWPSLACQVFVADPRRRTLEERREIADALFDRLATAPRR